MIPQGWQEKRLWEVTDWDKRFQSITNGKQRKILSFNHILAETMKTISVDNGDIKLLATGKFDGYTTEKLAGDNLNEGEVLTLPSGGTASIKYYNGKFVDSGNIIAQSTDTKRYYLKYIYYYLISINDFVASKYKGVSIKHPYMPEILEITIPLPPLPEQQRIVAKLDKAFEVIDKLKANAEQNLNNAKELFNDAQTTIFNEPFEEKKLGDICTLYQGLAINMKTKHLLCDKSTLPLLRIKDLKENCETQYVVEEGFPKNALVNESDIIYTRTGSLGLVFRGRKGVLHNNSFKVVPQKNISNDYLFEWLQNPIFNKKIVSLAQRAAQPDITHTLFKQQIINVPPFEIQLKKVKQINVIREYINTLNQIYTKKIKECDELKQSILQKAFRGEL